VSQRRRRLRRILIEGRHLDHPDRLRDGTSDQERLGHELFHICEVEMKFRIIRHIERTEKRSIL